MGPVKLLNDMRKTFTHILVIYIKGGQQSLTMIFLLAWSEVTYKLQLFYL